jgi:predicted site-specific integrase-resolvase
MSALFTTRQAAKKLGLDVSTLSRYISLGKIPAPKILEVGALKVHSWTEEDIERVRALLPTIKNGRKTWRQKKKQTEKKTKPKKK